VDLLDQLTELRPLDSDTTSRARSYAYHYFFRRMIPLTSLDPNGGIPPELNVRSLVDIDPGRDPGLDVICDGILTGSPFVFDA
jgi:hypothetical protein